MRTAKCLCRFSLAMPLNVHGRMNASEFVIGVIALLLLYQMLVEGKDTSGEARILDNVMHVCGYLPCFIYRNGCGEVSL